jgi:tRNA-Thr(GGU) m(6)t(6)A37 methyltransferase TsaA
MNEISYSSIGIIHTPFTEAKGVPIQSKVARNTMGTVEIFPEYREGLHDLSGFSHIILLYHFHLARGTSLKVVPFLDDRQHGVFATRASSRPNPLGLSVVKLNSIEGNILHVEELDIVNGTPLLDIKPFVPEFDNRDAGRVGWLENYIHKLSELKDDGRFTS